MLLSPKPSICVLRKENDKYKDKDKDKAKDKDKDNGKDNERVVSQLRGCCLAPSPQYVCSAKKMTNTNTKTKTKTKINTKTKGKAKIMAKSMTKS